MGSDFSKSTTIVCSFCGKTRTEVNKIITGVNVTNNICNECVDLCYKILIEDKKKEKAIEKKLAEVPLKTPNSK